MLTQVVTVQVSPGTYTHTSPLEVPSGLAYDLVVRGSELNPHAVVLSFEDSDGVLVSRGAKLHLLFVSITGNESAYSAFGLRATCGGVIDGSGITVSGFDYPFTAAWNGVMSISDAVAEGGQIGFRAHNGSRMQFPYSAVGAIAHDSYIAGFSAESGSSIAAGQSVADDCGIGFTAVQNAVISAVNTDLTSCGVGFMVAHGGLIDAFGATFTTTTIEFSPGLNALTADGSLIYQD